MTTKEDFKESHLLCLGSVHLKGHKAGIQFAILDDDMKETDQTMCFTKGKTVKGYPGNIYKTMMNETSVKAIQFVGVYEDEERRSFIQVESRAVEIAHQAYLQQKKSELDDSAIYELLKPLRQAYHSTNHLGQSALIARVINIMQRKL